MIVCASSEDIRARDLRAGDILLSYRRSTSGVQEQTIVLDVDDMDCGRRLRVRYLTFRDGKCFLDYWIFYGDPSEIVLRGWYLRQAAEGA